LGAPALFNADTAPAWKPRPPFPLPKGTVRPKNNGRFFFPRFPPPNPRPRPRGNPRKPPPFFPTKTKPRKGPPRMEKAGPPPRPPPGPRPRCAGPPWGPNPPGVPHPRGHWPRFFFFCTLKPALFSTPPPPPQGPRKPRPLAAQNGARARWLGFYSVRCAPCFGGPSPGAAPCSRWLHLPFLGFSLFCVFPPLAKIVRKSPPPPMGRPSPRSKWDRPFPVPPSAWGPLT